MRDRAESLFATGDKVAGDAYTAEQLGRQMAQRIKELSDDPAVPLFFGKLTMATDPQPGAAGPERWHIGRRHVPAVRRDGGPPTAPRRRRPWSACRRTAAPRGRRTVP
jgi:hypothetical protein